MSILFPVASASSEGVLKALPDLLLPLTFGSHEVSPSSFTFHFPSGL